ncbi:transcription factor-like protein DPB [Phragmites australis]|uniref:transcription factor-like protein DPB n=1 Tax=Phragmites australis TaxID=29695 RepID=UPI002D784A87|nr:transcription factor-like protein DPB [Phragmites australis]
MVSGVAHRPDKDGGAPAVQRPLPPVGARASPGAPTPSASTSGGSAGSPSSRSEQHAPDGAGKGAALAAAGASASASTPVSESTFLRLNNLDINGDDAPSSQAPTSKKKKRGARAVGPDKGNRGLRQFSMKVCEKVESKGRTTYNEVADELVAEFADPNNNIESPDPDNPNAQQYDEKNIRRRVYDALNVLMAMDIISKDKKEIQWKGLPRASIDDIEELKTELVGLKGRIEKKSAYLQELQDQYVGLQNLILRNEQLYGSGNTPPGGVILPFILVQTRPHATVEVEISEDMQLVHFDFNSTPFELHDDSYVLKEMRLCGREQHDGSQEPSSNGGESSSMPNIYRHQLQHPGGPNNGTIRLPTSPPIPGILKGRVKHEH